MRRMAVLAAAAIVLVAFPTAQAGQRAALRFAHLHPLAVSGHGFARGEKVRVTVHAAGRSSTVRTRASARGGFRVTFSRVTIATCDSLSVDAVGARGDRASLLRRAPACEPN